MTDTPTVQQAWANVMADVRALDKGDRNAQQGFNFRGVDATMNAVGPALRTHGVSVVPAGVTNVESSSYTTKSGTVMRDVFLVVSYLITGPGGDTMPGAAAGEASDAGDKATPKAMSVAYRTFLLQALCLPTQEVDPDAQTYERAAAAPAPSRADMAAQAAGALRDATTVEDVRLWAARVEAHQLAAEPLPQQSSGGSTTLGEYAAERLQAVAA